MTDNEKFSRREMIRSGVLGRWIENLLGQQSPAHDCQRDAHEPHLSPPPISSRRYPEKAADLPSGGPTRSRTSIPVLRPPGAIDEPSFLAECTRCDACLEACPHDAILHAPLRLREAAGTPMIDPMRQPCWMCDDRPCIGACEPGVLQHNRDDVMGTARITEETCLAYTGSFCTVCVEQCPVDGAITMTDGKPRIIEDKCTGCGVCQYVCPAPHNAILLMPALQRSVRTKPPGEVQHD